MKLINIKNLKDWFDSKEQFEFVKWCAIEFDAQWIKGIERIKMNQKNCKHWSKDKKNLCKKNGKTCYCDGNLWYCDYPKNKHKTEDKCQDMAKGV